MGENSLSTLCGTAQYVAPEILDFQVEGYDERCDMWSVGVVTYILLGGYAPFEGPPDELAQFIIRGDYEFHDKYWADISEEAKDMISGMLQTSPEHRLTAQEALHCEWMALDAGALAAKDLSTTKTQMKTSNTSSSEAQPEVKKAFQALLKTNKWLSLGAMAGGQNQPQKNQLDTLTEDDFEDLYDWGSQIGIGTFSVIHMSVERDTHTKWAVKRIPRNDLWEEDAVALQDEISSLQLVTDCPQVVHLKEVFEEPDFTYMVLEPLMGGYLIDRIIEQTCYSEDDAADVCERLLQGIAYCHAKRIAIRDIKPESILLEEGSTTKVKLADFGCAKQVHLENSLTTVCGTEAFVAPEIIEFHPAYDVQCDMWSMGVLLYLLLGGYRPFRGTGDECLEKVRYGMYKFAPKKYWDPISNDAKQLIAAMLTVDPARRITAAEALDMPWFFYDESAAAAPVVKQKSSSKEKKKKSKSKQHQVPPPVSGSGDFRF